MGPEHEFYLMAGNRKVVEGISFRRNLQIALQSSLLNKAEERISTLMVERDTNAAQSRAYRDAYNICNEDLMKSNLKVARLRPWAVVGKAGVVVVSVAVVGVVVAQVVQATMP